MKIDLSGRTAVMTGASRGLGEAMAKALAEAGARVALVARDVKRLESVRDAISQSGGKAAVFAGDVTREEDVAEVAQGVKELFGHAQILINNAGTNLRKDLVDFSLDEFRGVVDSSLISTFLMCRAFVPGMKGSGYGRVINMASIMGHISSARTHAVFLCQSGAPWPYAIAGPGTCSGRHHGEHHQPGPHCYGYERSALQQSRSE